MDTLQCDTKPGKALCTPQMIKRSTISGQPTAAPERPAVEDQPATGRCYLCGRKKNRKSRTRCPTCHLFVCREHTRFTCEQCAGVHVEGDSEDDE
ncbi:hypothetical protein J6590_074117 [Homalodisca vitripennis]|nr:hypothetical protein J6590_074117 [Homalodisca vitripennis]